MAVTLPPALTFQRLLLRHNEPADPNENFLCIRLPLFYRHLSDPSHRETYESAHSVILSIFASHAQRQHTGNNISDSSTQTSPTTATIVPNISNNNRTRVLSGVLNAGGDSKHGLEDERDFTTTIIPISNSHKEVEEESAISVNFVKRMVPFYAQCLIEVGVLCFTNSGHVFPLTCSAMSFVFNGHKKSDRHIFLFSLFHPLVRVY